MFKFKVKPEKMFNVPGQSPRKVDNNKQVELTSYRAIISSVKENKEEVDSYEHESSRLEKNCKKIKSFNRMADSRTVLVKTDHLSNFLREQIIGVDATFKGPFGHRKCLYVDTTASGKSLKSIEDFIRQSVLPFYANTHTTISFTSFLTTSYRDEAREIIKEGVGAGKDDLVLFCGFGSTACVHKIIHCLNIFNDKVKPVVLVGPYEHHSNLLPWRETGAETIIVPDDSSGSLDVIELEKYLKKITSNSKDKGRTIYACFSAGSNVTGAVMDDVQITKLVHKYGGYCLWNYSAAGPHVNIEMNPSTDKLTSKDAIFFSGHKFLGGPQTTGILVAKAHMFKNKVPHNGGGGTVFFVTSENHSYLTKIEDNQEGGTPGIIESIRLGLVFSLKHDIGVENICARESTFTKKVLRAWSTTKNLIVLGNLNSPRLPIISFVIEHAESGYYLHQNFVVALLNDLFGIQCRGGCMCAGTYGQTMLGMTLDPKIVGQYVKALSTDCRQFDGKTHKSEDPIYQMIYRPGYTRISLPFETSMEEVDFIIQAVQMIAKDGWKLLVQYHINAETGVIQHFSVEKNQQATKKRLSVLNINLNENILQEGLNLTRAEILTTAAEILNSTVQDYNQEEIQLIAEEDLRWFMLPTDAVKCMKNLSVRSKQPFKVNVGRYQSFHSNQDKSFTPKSIPFQLQNWPTILQSCSTKENDKNGQLERSDKFG